MENRLTRPACFMTRFAYAVYLLIAVLGIAFFLQWAPDVPKTVLLSVASLLAVVPLLSWGGDLGTRLGKGRTLAILLCLCFVLRLAWVLLVRIEPLGDYKVFYAYGVAFSSRESLDGAKYVALFPHIFGYSFFLSLFMKVFGASYLLAPILNVLLSTLSCGLLFSLCYRLGGLKTAVSSCLLWCFFPSQIIYNMFTLSEPLYTTGILGFLLLLQVLDEKLPAARPLPMVGLGLLAGVILALINFCRPLAAILIIATVLWLVFARLDSWRTKAFRAGALIFLACTLVCYVLVGRAGAAYTAYRLGEEPSYVPGYSIMVGFNSNSNGTWNLEDSDLLFSYRDEEGADASYAQEKMLEAAMARITSGKIDFLKLFKSKLYTFLSQDSSCVTYAASVLRHKEEFSLLCNAFYGMVALLAVVGSWDALRKKDRSALFPAMLYFVGLTMAHMLVEVAGRYHYSLLVPLCILGARGAGVLWDLVGHFRKAK